MNVETMDMANKITYEQIEKANKTIKPMKIKRKNKETGEIVSKDYAEVNQRLKAYRMVYPKGTIKPTILTLENGICVIQAEVFDETGNLLSMATAQENQKSSYINQTNYIENCETSAIGRALGFAGFGINSAIASAEDIKNEIDKENYDEPMDSEQLTIIASFNPDMKEKIVKTYKKDFTELTKKEAEKVINSAIKNGLIKTKEEKEKEIKEKEDAF